MKKEVIVITKQQQYEHDKYLDMLSLYYKHLFPAEYIHKWLSHNNSDHSVFGRRHFALVTIDAHKNETYERNISLKSLEMLRRYLQFRLPHRIEIGAIMNKRPLSAQFSKPLCAVEKELVFDIDASDYDEVRTCCSGKKICHKCWKFMIVASKILRIVLNEDFGFEHTLWVFSGRRGIHCWVCDSNARVLTKDIREALVNYFCLPLRLFKHNDHLPIKWSHPLIQRALKIIKIMFDEICLEDQNIFSDWKNVEKFLIAEIQDQKNRENLRELLGNVMDCGSFIIWSAFCAYVESQEKQLNGDINLIESVQICLLYPRLDVNVTKGIEHLLKAPFNVHPDTHKICIPFDPDQIEVFDVNTVPTLPVLCQEIEQCLKKNVSVSKISILNRALTIFRDFVIKLK
ncbi:DNA primase small subunit-like isoform X2 [Phlebotomus papatasi]|uniref:DNA primase small subunit-like isoform X2 n=1 Tax=Phlebotomus papatasi TaxID=29031 RepID=UPI002484523D|nr:DNA primase small subunit-like isoform X2 [Phlebotomus papatasi]